MKQIYLDLRIKCKIERISIISIQLDLLISLFFIFFADMDSI